MALVTGLKHYLGPFEAYAKEGRLLGTPVREEHPRLPLPNFYYAQEDEMYKASEGDGFTWSIHRPHTVVGYTVGNLMNIASTLAVYASICKETGRKFIWPGSFEQWNGVSDVTDAQILAKQLVWASTTDSAKNKAFNITNGDIFRWKWLWQRLADYFEIEAVGFEGEIKPLEKEMENDQEVWKDIVQKYQLMCDMTNSRNLGFKEYQNTERSFIDVFEKLKAERNLSVVLEIVMERFASGCFQRMTNFLVNH